ncbi:MAG: ABC transporter permease, partial [Armatimonadetes bacterium]|nr:ABC transporter permease [Armatimonadota bacterium]
HMANLFMEPVFFLSGFYFPVRALGFWAGMGASLIPLTLALDAMRQLLYAGTHPALLPILTELAILVGLGVVFILLARFLLKRMEFLARREGRLSLRF